MSDNVKTSICRRLAATAASEDVRGLASAAGSEPGTAVAPTEAAALLAAAVAFAAAGQAYLSAAGRA